MKQGWFLEVESQLGKSFKVIFRDKHLYGIERTLLIFDYY